MEEKAAEEYLKSIEEKQIAAVSEMELLKAAVLELKEQVDMIMKALPYFRYK